MTDSKFIKLSFIRDPKEYNIKLIPSIVKYIKKKSNVLNKIKINNNKKEKIIGNSLRLIMLGFFNILFFIINRIRINDMMINNLLVKIYSLVANKLQKTMLLLPRIIFTTHKKKRMIIKKMYL